MRIGNNPRNNQNNQPNASFQQQVKDFWNNIGIFTKIIFTINIVSHALQYYFDTNKTQFSICYSPVIDQLQFYRFFTSEFSHANFSHIFFNMMWTLMFGWEVEKIYGTLFYACLNFMIMILSNFMMIGIEGFLVFVWPYSLYGGISNVSCSIGYSNVVFGILMLFSTVGDPYATILGFLKVKRIYIPFILLVITQLIVPNASFKGHFTGVVAALLIKYCGVYLIMPKYEWIYAFDESYANQLEQKVMYYRGTPEIEPDFNSKLWQKLYNLITKNSGNRMQNMSIGSNQIEFSNYSTRNNI